LKKITSLGEIERITGGNPVIIKELLAIFIKEASLQMQKMQEYLADSNFTELKNVAHKMKSSLTLIGMDKYRLIAEELENEAGDDPKTTKKQIIELVIVYTRAITELKIKLQELS
jgi:HPt (histidine-containing phosphotransfer) domain-containing protein